MFSVSLSKTNHKQELGLLINMEVHTLDNFHDDFETGRWMVRKFILPNASDYLWDIENITWAQTGLIDAFGANRFFDEASQMIANSIYLFQKGFFDTAFYSLRQSIELSIGTLYLTANPEKMIEWKKLEPKSLLSLKIYVLFRERQINMCINKAIHPFIPHKGIHGRITVKIKFISI